MDEPRIVPGKSRKLQVAGTRRKLFDRKAQAVFLEHLAASCNVKQAAAAAGFRHSTVYRLRITDPLFREGWDRVIEQGYARLELIMLEQAMRGAEPIALSGDGDAPEGEAWDRDLAMQLLREHKRVPAAGRVGGPAPRREDIEEVRERLFKKLKALGVQPE